MVVASGVDERVPVLHVHVERCLMAQRRALEVVVDDDEDASISLNDVEDSEAKDDDDDESFSFVFFLPPNNIS